MTIPITCGCGKRIRVSEELAGRTIKCASCSGPVLVPHLKNTSAPTNVQANEIGIDGPKSKSTGISEDDVLDLLGPMTAASTPAEDEKPGISLIAPQADDAPSPTTDSVSDPLAVSDDDDVYRLAPSTPLPSTSSRPASSEDESDHRIRAADRPRKSKARKNAALPHDGRSLESQRGVNFRLRKFLFLGGVVFAFVIMLSLLIAWSKRPPPWPPDLTRYSAGRDLIGVWDYGVQVDRVYGARAPSFQITGDGDEIYIFHPDGTGEHKDWYDNKYRRTFPMRWTCNDKHFYIGNLDSESNSTKWAAPQDIAGFIKNKQRLQLNPKELVVEDWTGLCPLGDINTFTIPRWGPVRMSIEASTQFITLDDGQLEGDDSMPLQGHITGTLRGEKATVNDKKYHFDIERKDQALIVTARDALKAQLWTTTLQPRTFKAQRMPAP